MSEKLLPCPFCGGAPHTWEDHQPNGTSWHIACEGCDCYFDSGYDSMETAHAAWNRRSPPPAVEGGWRDVLAERERQKTVEGWTLKRDDGYKSGQLSKAAACYALSAGQWMTRPANPLSGLWPFPSKWWKPTTPRRDLVKAGALILAEIERLDRATPPTIRGEKP